MKSRIVTLLLALVLVLMLVPAVSAQGDPSCLGLSADDCTILQTATANSENITSFNISYKFNFGLTGLSMLAPGTSDIVLTSDGGGPFAMDMAMMTPDNPFAGLQLAMDMNGSLNDGTSEQSGSFSFMIVDGNFYMQDPTSGQWAGVNLMELVNSGVLEQAGLPITPEMLMGGMAGAEAGSTDPMAALSMLGLGDMDPNSLMNIPGFITNARLADESMMGQTMYPFTTTIDMAPLFASPEFNQILSGVLETAGSSDPSMAQVGPMVAMLLQNSQLTISTGQWIGADDMFVHRFTLDINAVIDLSALMGGAGSTSNTAQLPPINFNMSLDVSLNDINAPVSVVAPEGAEIIPASTFMGGAQ